jgi:mitochondrial protein import protein ZIM17
MAARSLCIGNPRRPSAAALTATGCRSIRRRQDDNIPFPVVGGGDGPWRRQRKWSSSSRPPTTATTGDDDDDSPIGRGGMAPTATITDETTTTTTLSSKETTRKALSNTENDPARANDNDNDDGLRIKVNLPNDGRDWQVPGVETGGRKLAAVFTCKVCNTRSMKQFTEQAYQSGVVIVRCPGCQNRHVLADRLGYFDDTDIDLERIARDNGESLTTVTSMGDDATDARQKGK